MNQHPSIEKYADIIDSPRSISRKHPPMDRASRAAQFAPYATLAGHQDDVARDENLANSDSDF